MKTVDPYCFDRCNACRHRHYGNEFGYRCSKKGCDCRDRYEPKDAA